MTTTTIDSRGIGLTAGRTSVTGPVGWLRIMVGSLIATALLIGLMALAGRALPPHPQWAEPSPGGLIEFVDA